MIAESHHEDWDPPGGGTWERDRSHFDRTVTPIVAALIERGAREGIREGFELIGAPLDTMDVRFVNGQMYRCLVPIIGAPKRPSTTPARQPPTWLVRAAFAVHPRLRRRAARAQEALDTASWQDEADRWDTEWKPSIIATNRRLGAVDLPALGDRALAEHIDEVIDHVGRSFVLHFRLHITDMGPIALLLDHCRGWGIDAHQVMPALAGASPATNAAQDELRPLAHHLSESGMEWETLDDVRASSEEAARLLDDYLDEFGDRLTSGYDITDLTLAEMPGAIAAMLASPELLAERPGLELARERGAAAAEELRQRVPPDQRVDFERLLADARRLYGLRDENGPITAEWPGGILRRSLQEAGRRLAAAGRLDADDHVVDLTAVEVVGALHGEPGPRSTAVAARRRRRLARRDRPSPAFLGPPPSEPDLDALPDAMSRMMRMSVDAVALLEQDPDVEGLLDGTGIGSESYRGVARVVADADDAIERCEPGDVIVTRFTAPTFNSVLGIAGAVVTEQGGLLSHTAVIARELGIAAVVGAPGALTIPDGAEVDVDPVAGCVTIL